MEWPTMTCAYENVGTVARQDSEEIGGSLRQGHAVLGAHHH